MLICHVRCEPNTNNGRVSQPRPRPPTTAPPLNGRLAGGLAMSTPEEEDAASGTNLQSKTKMEQWLEWRQGEKDGDTTKKT